MFSNIVYAPSFYGRDANISINEITEVVSYFIDWRDGSSATYTEGYALTRSKAF